MRKQTSIVLVIVGLLAALSYLWVTWRSAGKPQYIFMICMDAVRPDHLSCYGYSRNTSPRIDEMARRGSLFEDAVSQAPWTIPSIATILSSSFPCQHGARRTEGTQVVYAGLANNFIEKLSEMGFKTALFTGGLTVRGKIPAAELAGASLDWLHQNLEHPCFIVIHHYDTHSPYVAARDCIESLDPGYDGPYRFRFGDFEMLRQARVGRLAEAINLDEADLRHIKALYDCQIMRADRSMGMIVDSLEAWDCLGKSMIILFADHGEEFLEHGSIDHGQTVHEESIRVPLIVFCPAIIRGPKRIPQQVGLIDMGPTIFDALSVEGPADFEGTSLMPLVSKRFKAEASRLRPCGLPRSCLIAEAIARRSEKKAIRRPPWKLIFDPFMGASGLYNIAEDPFEMHNLIEARPAIVSALTDTLLIMESHYPGGWCVAWRGPAEHGTIRGIIDIDVGILEATAHNMLPEVDPEVDSLVVSDDWRSVRFRTEIDDEWEGIEVRMASRTDATFDIVTADRPGITATIGYRKDRIRFPISVSPLEARVDRRDLRDLYAYTNAECLIYWLEPGAEPTAKRKTQEELKRQLKAIGYID